MQAKLYETSNIIEVHLQSNGLGSSGTIGIENSTGTVGYQAICNSATSNGTAWRWTPIPDCSTPNNTTTTAAICIGTTKSLTATPAGGTWSIVSGGGSISGTTYTPASTGSKTIRYTVTGGCYHDVTFTVNNLTNSGTLSGSVSSNQTICPWQTPSTLTFTGSGVTVEKWQYSIDGGASWVDIANTSTTFSPGALYQTTLYRAVVKNLSTCTRHNSNHATITVSDVASSYTVAAATAASLGITVTPDAPLGDGGNISKNGGLTIQYSKANWTGACVNWGLPLQMKVANGTSTGPCTFNENLTFNLYHAFTSLPNGNLCFEGTTLMSNLMGPGGAVSNVTMPVRLRISIRKTSDNTPIPVSYAGGYLMANIKENFYIKAWIEIRATAGTTYYTTSIPTVNGSWATPNGTISNGTTWHPALAYFDNLYKSASARFCSSYNADTFWKFNGISGQNITPTEVCTGNALNLSVSTGNITTTCGNSYNWWGPNSFTSTSASPTVTSNASVTHQGTYNVNIHAGSAFANVCLTTATQNVTVRPTSMAPLETTVSPVGNCGGNTVTLKVNDKVGKGGEINHSTWTTGSGSTTNYNQNGATVENQRINSTDPWGNSAVLWEARSDGGDDASGGWNTTTFPIDNTKTYRFSVWVKRSVIGNGSTYLGVYGYSSGRQNPYAKAYGGEGTITLEPNGVLNYYYGTNGGNGDNYQGFGTTAGVVTAGNWVHIAIVRDLKNNILRWYINGVQNNSATATYSAAKAGNLPVTIGTGYAGGFNGAIDEVRGSVPKSVYGIKRNS